MDLQLPTRITLQLQEIAKVQDREIPVIIMAAIAEYVERHTHETAFREEVQATMAQHKWLLDELAER